MVIPIIYSFISSGTFRALCGLLPHCSVFLLIWGGWPWGPPGGAFYTCEHPVRELPPPNYHFKIALLFITLQCLTKLYINCMTAVNRGSIVFLVPSIVVPIPGRISLFIVCLPTWTARPTGGRTSMGFCLLGTWHLDQHGHKAGCQ